MLTAADVSYYQNVADDTYTRQWLIVRCCDGTFFDPNAIANAAWCRWAVSVGKMTGWTAYVVYRLGLNQFILENLALIYPLDRVMIDVESWGGQIKGDHSAEINQLADSLANLVGQSHVWIYGNQGDLASIAPGRHPWMRVVVAAYGPNKPNVPNMIGWQYTNGQYLSGDRPRSSAPFGYCDHNELYVDELSLEGGGSLVEEDDMLTPEQDAAIALLPGMNAKYDANRINIAGELAAYILGMNDKIDTINQTLASLVAVVQTLSGPNPIDVSGAVEAGISNAFASQHASPITITLTGTGTPT